jgi:hypothetical protein
VIHCGPEWPPFKRPAIVEKLSSQVNFQPVPPSQKIDKKEKKYKLLRCNAYVCTHYDLWIPFCRLYAARAEAIEKQVEKRCGGGGKPLCSLGMKPRYIHSGQN